VLLMAGTVLGLYGGQDGALLLGLALAVFTLLTAPMGNTLRYVLIGAVSALLIGLRAGWLPLSGARAIMPLLGSMFMFRLILFLHERAHSRPDAGPWKNASYFFQLPNLAFVIFPVTDYQTFLKQYYSRPAAEVYRRGLLMVANGLFHLFLYRLIYYYLLPPPSAVTDLLSLSQYLVASYALIVRLAGIFHFSVGVMCLFGFYLPPVFEHYFFARSFSDIWRRINIYWRDFMTKVFYYPIYFRLKHLGTIRAMVLSILLVFAINWFLHAWQWFWIRGSFPLTWQDGIFWSFFGLAVAVNTWLQTRSSRRPANHGFRWASAGRLSLQVLGMFTTMTLLWSFWTSGSVSEWWTLMQAARQSSGRALGLLLGAVMLLVSAGTLYQYAAHRARSYSPLPLRWERYKTGFATIGLAGMVAFGMPGLHQPMALVWKKDLEPVFSTKLNAYDREQLYKGYYETLLVGSNLCSRIWELEQKKPDDWQQLGFSGAGIRRDDIMLKELKPNQQIPFKGGLFTTNNLGLRDRDYPAEKPAHKLRIALLGGSIEMGVGVNTDQTWENLAEDMINEQTLLGDSLQVEILNFGISGNHLYQNVAMFDLKARHLQPDALFYAAHSNEGHRILNSIYKAYTTGRDMVYPYLTELLDQHGITRATTEASFMATLSPKQEEIALAGYRLLLEFAKEIKALAVWLYVPTLDDNEIPGEADRLEAAVRAMGFFTLRMDDAYRGRDAESLKLAEWDTHPNIEGHRLLALELFKNLSADPALIRALAGEAD